MKTVDTLQKKKGQIFVYNNKYYNKFYTKNTAKLLNF